MNFIKFIYYAIRNAIKRASKSTSSEEYEAFMAQFDASKSLMCIDIDKQLNEHKVKELELKIREMFNNKEIDGNEYERIQRILTEHLDEVQNEDIGLHHNAKSNADPNTDADSKDG